VFDVPNLLKSRGFGGAADLVEGDTTVCGFENAFTVYIGAIGSAFASAVIDFIVIKGV